MFCLCSLSKYLASFAYCHLFCKDSLESLCCWWFYKSMSPWKGEGSWNWGLYAFFFFFLGPHLQHMEVPRPEVESDLRLLAYIPATAMPDLSRSVMLLCCSLHQRWILNTLSEARDWSQIPMDTGQVLNPQKHNRNAYLHFFWWILSYPSQGGRGKRGQVFGNAKLPIHCVKISPALCFWNDANSFLFAHKQEKVALVPFPPTQCLTVTCREFTF